MTGLQTTWVPSRLPVLLYIIPKRFQTWWCSPDALSIVPVNGPRPPGCQLQIAACRSIRGCWVAVPNCIGGFDVCKMANDTPCAMHTLADCLAGRGSGQRDANLLVSEMMSCCTSCPAGVYDVYTTPKGRWSWPDDESRSEFQGWYGLRTSWI